MNKFRGLGVAMVTPFKKDKAVDFKALEKLTEHLVSNGCDYLVVMGTTGENPTISVSEQLDILKYIKKVNEGRKPIVFGLGGNNTEAIIDKIESFDWKGVDAILSVSPYYNKPNQEGIYRHFNAIADASPVPVIIYNVPGRTGSTISVDTTLRLAEHDNIIATKEASGDMDHCMAIIEKKPESFEVISGDDSLTLPFISAGMSGVISVIGNAYPKEFSQMVNYALEGNFENARYLHYKLLPLMTGIFSDGSPGGIKEVLASLDICEPHVREPLFAVNKEVKNFLLQEAAKL
jgi:4-hydroxy-tetrahydrodipicolinate synthase